MALMALMTGVRARRILKRALILTQIHVSGPTQCTVALLVRLCFPWQSVDLSQACQSLLQDLSIRRCALSVHLSTHLSVAVAH